MNPRAFTRAALSSLVTAAALGATAWLSAAPIDAAAEHGTAAIRLSWSARPERIETCRELSKEELEQREEHMRQRVECEGKFATYSLTVSVDDRPVHRSVVRGGGLRNDRPIFLLRDIPVDGGLHRVRVDFRRREKTDDDAAAFASSRRFDDDSGIFAGRAEREAEERARRARAAIPPLLVLDTKLRFSVGEVAVVSLDAERAELVLLRGR